ncbi:MAG: ATP-dependent helicase HrpB [Myxococcota bacterium]
MRGLPVDGALGEVQAAVKAGNLLVTAPPGSGKTTRVPWAVQEALGGQVLVLEPRRLAARMASRFMARSVGESVGDRVGLVTRHERKEGRALVVMTEGVLVRRLESQPELPGVSAVILDEFHERSVQLDLSAALLREVQDALRPDLRIVVMSATIEPEPVRRFFAPCAWVQAEGRPQPLRIEHDPVDAREPSEVARALRRTAKRAEGDILVFLPGVPEIEAVRRALGAEPGGRQVVGLHGGLSAQAQDEAVRPGTRARIILSTNVAESSVTVPGVRCVVDSGWVKQAEYDPGRGVDSLVLRKAGRFSADQRAGRAAREGPGLAVRLWPAQEQRPQSDRAEIHRVDLAPALLSVLAWSPMDPNEFPWFEAPESGRIGSGVDLLRRLALVDGWRLSELGGRVARWPLHPRWGVVLERADELGVLELALDQVAVADGREVLRSPGGLSDQVGDSDLELRSLAVFEGLGEVLEGAAAEARRVRAQLARQGRRAPGGRIRGEAEVRRAILAGFPDRVGMRRGPSIQLAFGGGAAADPRSVVKRDGLLVALDVGRGPKESKARLRMAVAIEEAWLSGTEVEAGAHFDPKSERVEAEEHRRYGALILSRRPSLSPDPEAIRLALVEAAERHLDRALPWTPELRNFVLRLRRWAEVDPEAVPEGAVPEDVRRALLPELAFGSKSFAELRQRDLVQAWCARFPGLRQALDAALPNRWRLPSGRSAAIAHPEDGPPRLSAPIQELFGMTETPRLAGGRLALAVELLAPNGRPVQLTQDLASFWRDTYGKVRKDLRGRYPKHHWPETPTAQDAGPLGRRRGRASHD